MAAAVRWASACPSACPLLRTLRDRKSFLGRVATGGRIRDRPAAALRFFPWVHSRPLRTDAGSPGVVSPPDTASGGSRRRHGRKAHARGAHCPLLPKAAAGHLRYAARRAAARPLCVWSRAQGARSMRAPPVAVPRPQGAGARQTRPPAPVAPGRCGASPRVCLGSSAAWGASRRPAPIWGHVRRGGRTAPAFCRPPCGCGCAACRGFLPAPPRPSPAGPREARGHDRLRAGTGAAHIGLRPSTGPSPTPSAVGRARHTREVGFCASPRTPA